MHLLDSNVFITAKNTYYGMDIAPGFWQWLEQAHAAGAIASVQAVEEELQRGRDALAAWAQAHPSFFLKPGASVPASLTSLARWAVSQHFTPAAQATFLDSADYFLIAHAHAEQHTVVTLERSDPSARRRILIPDACAALKVLVIDTFEMMRREGVRLVL